MASGIPGVNFWESSDIDMKPVWIDGSFSSPPPCHLIAQR
jgi:hypothetical protein